MAQQIHVDVLSDCLAMGKTVESFVSAFFLLIQKLQGRPVRMQPICAAKTKDFGVSSSPNENNSDKTIQCVVHLSLAMLINNLSKATS